MNTLVIVGPKQFKAIGRTTAGIDVTKTVTKAESPLPCIREEPAETINLLRSLLFHVGSRFEADLGIAERS